MKKLFIFLASMVLLLSPDLSRGDIRFNDISFESGVADLAVNSSGP